MRVVDSRTNVVTMAFNNWGLMSLLTEPSTTAHPALTDRQWTMTYNVAGQVASEVRPGAVTVTKTYDNLGRLTVESGSGGGSTTASRTLAYDSGSRMTAAGSQLFTYDPRGMLAGSTGPQGATTFGYDSLGRRTSRVDAAGSVAYGWNGRWDLTSAVVGSASLVKPAFG